MNFPVFDSFSLRAPTDKMRQVWNKAQKIRFFMLRFLRYIFTGA